ncbi:PPM-type phosphatase domain-containing protein [Balamuthia mandrillaris]
MGNLTSFEVNLEDFNINDPTPIDKLQKEALKRGQDTGRVDFSLQSLSDVPIQVFELSNLTTLNLSVNKLKFLPQSLFEMRSLTNLDLSSNELELLPAQISKLTALETLNVRHNCIATLPASLGEIESLQKLNLEYNHLKTLPSFARLTQLKELKLKYNALSKLPSPLGGVSGSLDLQNNELVVSPPWEGLDNAKELLLENNWIETLNEEHMNCLSSVTKLMICNNRLKELPDGIRQMTALVEADFRENHLLEIPVAFTELKTLKKLNLANNKLKSLPPEIWNLTGLLVFNAGYNQLEDLPPGLANMPTLKELHLGGNRFSDIPAEICQLSTLQQLFLGWNDLTRVDPSIGNLARLTSLHLSGNRIQELPEEIRTMKALKELYLAGNELSALPESMCELRGLEKLDLRYNKLVYIPAGLRALNFLERLNLQDNPPFSVPKELYDKKNLHVEEGGGVQSSRFQVVQADMQGRRWNMEDAVVCTVNYRNIAENEYVAVFDGHGGDKAALQAAKRHPEILAEELKTFCGVPAKAGMEDEDDVFEALKSSFIKCSKEMTPELIKRSGTTAIVSVILGNKMYVANVGDSRAVSYKNGKVIRVSLDHKPDLPEEEKRIRNLGGFVSPNGRVVGMLAVSRAFGDIDLQPFVSADPFVDVYDISDPPDFLIMACDGVWDVISDETACEIVASEPDLVRAAMKLRDLAYLFGSQDNISVVLLRFKAE